MIPMKAKTPRLILAAILGVSLFCMGTGEALAARLIKASVSYEGKLILKGTWSDSGSVDADGVWEYLKKIQFVPTEAFKALKVDPTAKKTVLSGAGKGVALSDSKITVSIVAGGESKFRQLTLTRLAKDKQGREWMLSPEEVDVWFAYRLIGRREAAQLRDPKKLKK
jgi:hypothetical protein